MSQSTLDAINAGVTAEEQPDDDEDDCDCEDLPGEWPCSECYISGEKELPEDDA